MFRFLLLLIALLVGFGAWIWYSSQSLPDWYQPDQPQTEQVVQNLTGQIEEQGVTQFLGDKFADVMRGEMHLNDAEFNALVLTSLRGHRDGRRLLAVSDAVKTTLSDDGVELGVIINFEKVAKADAKSREALDRALEVIPFEQDQRVFVAIRGTPVARDGNLAFSDDISVRLGAIPISNAMLKQIGVPVERALRESLPLSFMSIREVVTSDGKISFAVRPRF